MSTYRMPGRVLPDENQELEAFSRLVRRPEKQRWEWLRWSALGGFATCLLSLALVGFEEAGAGRPAPWICLGLGLAFESVVAHRYHRIYRDRSRCASALERGANDLEERAPARLRFVSDELPAEVDEVPMVAEPGGLRANAEGHA